MLLHVVTVVVCRHKLWLNRSAFGITAVAYKQGWCLYTGLAFINRAGVYTAALGLLGLRGAFEGLNAVLKG